MTDEPDQTTGAREAPAAAGATTVDAPEVGQARLTWADDQMTTSYANAVNVVSTQEEVMLFFGTNQTWNPSEAHEVKVQLSNRVILNPHAAKRLYNMLSNVLGQYEQRFGKL